MAAENERFTDDSDNTEGPVDDDGFAERDEYYEEPIGG